MAQSTHHRHYRLLLELLRDARLRIGITQAQLADTFGNTQTFVSKVERGERRLDVVEFLEWCEALGLAPAKVIADLQRVGSKNSGPRGKLAASRKR
jgi:transcriptional regulator with XRE-family HTH domain